MLSVYHQYQQTLLLFSFLLFEAVVSMWRPLQARTKMTTSALKQLPYTAKTALHLTVEIVVQCNRINK